jgi:hypothetical protein
MFDRISSLSISRIEDVRPIALRATICFFLCKHKLDVREILKEALGSYGLNVDLNVDALIFLCKTFGITHEIFLEQLKVFESSVVRNFEKVYLSLGEGEGLEH